MLSALVLIPSLLVFPGLNDGTSILMEDIISQCVLQIRNHL